MATKKKLPVLKKVTVALKDLDQVCRLCGKVKDDVRPRTYRSNIYIGPCGDSFCYHSCDSETCHEKRATICDACFQKDSKKP